MQVRVGCLTDTITNEVVVQVCDSTPVPYEVVIPNVFSPNEDQINDFFLEQSFCQFNAYQLSIFNRWGSQVFQSDSPKIGWNGKLNNSRNLLPEGTYFFVLQYTSAEQVEVLEKGTLLLLR